ncbi:MAG: potassium transporter TrkG [Bacillota bacterium]
MFYLVVILLGITFVTFNTFEQSGGNFFFTLRQSAFQVVSITTTTGYATANFDGWYNFFRLLLLMVMFLGGCGGSTGGTMKQVRWILMFKYAFRELSHVINPSAISLVKLGKQFVNEEVLRSVMGFQDGFGPAHLRRESGHDFL